MAPKDTTTETSFETAPSTPPPQPAVEVPRQSSLPSAVDEGPDVVLPKNSGLLPASPPPDFEGEFGTGVGATPFRGSFGIAPVPSSPGKYYTNTSYQ